MAQSQPYLDVSDVEMGTEFNRSPFALKHFLHQAEFFQAQYLNALAKKYDNQKQDYFIASSASKPSTTFYAVPKAVATPVEALDGLDHVPTRILLKRPENYDTAFKELLNNLFEAVVEYRPELRKDNLLRLESSIFISSSETTTPFHFDPEVNFFFQIMGEKEYHVYRPEVLSERELETFYKHNVIDIGQVPLDGRDASKECVFRLAPGLGLHQPQNAPHWVRTGPQRSISYAFVFETETTRVRSQTRAFNYYQRRMGITPSQIGQHSEMDGAKARAFRMAGPLKKAVGKGLKKTRLLATTND